MRIALIAGLMMLAPYNSAGAATISENWSCSYPDFTYAHNPVPVSYKRTGDVLEEITPSLLPGVLPDEVLQFRIIIEDDSGIIAERHFTLHSEGAIPNTVVAFLIAINKQSGDYTRNFIAAPNAGNALAAGRCIRR